MTKIDGPVDQREGKKYSFCRPVILYLLELGTSSLQTYCLITFLVLFGISSIGHLGIAMSQSLFFSPIVFHQTKIAYILKHGH
jgi:hypothetical protein